MEWQEPAALALVAVAAFLLVRQQVRSYRRRRAGACAADCNCTAAERAPGETDRVQGPVTMRMQ
jgi:hypothetical protein